MTKMPTNRNTARSYIIAAVNACKGRKGFKKALDFYTKKMEEINTELKDGTKKTERYLDNEMKWSEILEARDKLPKDSIEYVVMSLYTMSPPRRNQDYQFMKVVKTASQANNQDFNYYIMDDHRFVFNKYKTAKAHGEQTFVIPDELVNSINLYLSKHPATKKKPFDFLVNFDGSPLQSVNSITRILNRIFGKNVGATMLRHIYLSSKYDVEEMNKDAEQMGHTSGMQHEYMKINLPTV